MKSSERFSQTVENYLKYRPSYPKEVLQVMIDDCALTPGKVVADVGSGTGFLSKLFLDYGNIVYGIEPNGPMRKAAELYLKAYKHFHSLDGMAESTGLAASSIDLITVGTAFHWFDPQKTVLEFKRILKEPGRVLLVWNVRDIENSELLRAYEEFITKYGTDYQDSNAIQFEKTAVKEFFSPFSMQVKSFKNSQRLDWEGFKGRLLSASYSLRPGDLGFDQMLKKLRVLFDGYQKEGCVDFLYKTMMYYGRLL